MTPLAFLAAWRQRWGKDGQGLPTLPYARGKVFDYVDQLAHAPQWDRWGLKYLVIAAAFAFFALCMGVEPTVNGQISLSMFLVVVAMVVGRYSEAAFAMALTFLALFCSAIYLANRASHVFELVLQGVGGVGLTFFIAELLLVASIFTRSAERIWPRISGVPDVRLDPKDQPKLQVVLLAADLEDAVVALYAEMTQVAELDDVQVEYVVIDRAHRVAIAEACDQSGIRYVVDASQQQSVAERLVCASRHCHPGFVMVRHSAEDGVGFVAFRVLPWFVKAMGLKLLHTPAYTLPQLDPLCLKWLDGRSDPSSDAAGYALLRLDASDIDAAQSDASANTGWLQRLIRRSTMIFSENNAEGLSTDLSKIDYPATGWSIKARQLIHALAERLEFYRPALWFLLGLMAPLTLIWNYKTLPGADSLMLAQAGAHAICLYLVVQRASLKARFGLFDGFSQLFLTMFIWLTNAISAIVTTVKHTRLTLRELKRSLSVSDFLLWPLLLGSLFLINLIAATFGLLDISVLHTQARTEQILWILLSAMVLVVLLARYSVMLEAQSAADILEAKARIPAVLRSDRGRTVRVETLNFPSKVIILQVPISDLPRSKSWQLQFPGPLESELLEVSIQPGSFGQMIASVQTKSIEAFERVVDAMMQRAPDQPVWMPGSSKDNPLPAWVHTMINSISGKLVEVFTDPSKILQWLQVWRFFKK